MRTWQVEHRKRTRYLIELGGLLVKAGVVELTGNGRVLILGTLLWMAEKLKSEEGERPRAIWIKLGTMAIEVDHIFEVHSGPQVQQDRV